MLDLVTSETTEAVIISRENWKENVMDDIDASREALGALFPHDSRLMDVGAVELQSVAMRYHEETAREAAAPSAADHS